jgi:2-polyprenyl-3-methyl-5-hydroxy-6-metoxy-1,4-benzoquinol methylase
LARSRYTAEVDLDNLNTTHALAVLDVRPGSLVLDVGCADGSVARRLAERGCRVVGIEIDPEAAAAAARYCEQVIVGDIETLDLHAATDAREFDHVLFLDVLEHLRDPPAALKAASNRLKPEGRAVLSVPNVTHAALRLQLLAGRFEYTETGLLDRTHLHFFDRQALERLISQAGLTVVERMRTTAGLTQTEIPIDADDFPADALDLALSGEDADTYQFVYVVTPGHPQPASGDTRSLGEALQRRVHEAERVRAEAEGYVRELEVNLAETKQAEADARERATWLEAELNRRTSEIEHHYEQLDHLKMELAIKNEQLAALQIELAPIRARAEQLEKTLGYARHRLVDRASAATKRVPALHRVLKRVAERVGYTRR